MKGGVASLVPLEPVGIGIAVAIVFFAWGWARAARVPLRTWQASLGHPTDGVGRDPRRAAADRLDHLLGGIANHQGRGLLTYPSVGHRDRRHGRRAREAPKDPLRAASLAPRRSRIRAAGTPILCTSEASVSSTVEGWTRDVTDDPAWKAARRWEMRALISDGVFVHYPPAAGLDPVLARRSTRQGPLPRISTVGHGLTRFTRPVRP